MKIRDEETQKWIAKFVITQYRQYRDEGGYNGKFVNLFVPEAVQDVFIGVYKDNHVEEYEEKPHKYIIKFKPSNLSKSTDNRTWYVGCHASNEALLDRKFAQRYESREKALFGAIDCFTNCEYDVEIEEVEE